jgi:hypothetical protein
MKLEPPDTRHWLETWSTWCAEDPDAVESKFTPGWARLVSLEDQRELLASHNTAFLHWLARHGWSDGCSPKSMTVEICWNPNYPLKYTAKSGAEVPARADRRALVNYLVYDLISWFGDKGWPEGHSGRSRFDNDEGAAIREIRAMAKVVCSHEIRRGMFGSFVRSLRQARAPAETITRGKRVSRTRG